MVLTYQDEFTILCDMAKIKSNAWDEDTFIDPQTDEELDFDGVPKEDGCIGSHNLMLWELYADSHSVSNSDTEEEYITSRIDQGLYEEGEMRIYGMRIEEDGSVSMMLRAHGIGCDSDTIYPTFKYNLVLGKWVHFQRYDDGDVWVLCLSFGRYV